jgi:hypothetical protein
MQARAIRCAALALQIPITMHNRREIFFVAVNWRIKATLNLTFDGP